jgi:transcriptional regulator with XRE-family HTH domain
MDAAEVFRAVRRRTALSQRGLAERAGVGLTTIAAVEAGTRTPTVAVLTAVLEVAGLELSVDVPPVELDEWQRTHLRLSLTQRLHVALGGDGRPQYGPALPRWQQLVGLAARGDVTLHAALARAMWLPSEGPVREAEVCAQAWSRGGLPDVPDVVVRPACGTHARAPVVVSVSPWRMRVDPPAELALDPRFAADRSALRAVARVLHREAARADAGRRARSHRDPAHEAERAHVFHTKRFGRLAMPDPRDTRAWRLHDDASLVQWLRGYGYPV